MQLLMFKSVVSVLACTLILCGSLQVHAITIKNSIEASAHTGGQTSINGTDGKDGEDGHDGSSGSDGSPGRNGNASASAQVKTYVNGEEVTNISQKEVSETEDESVSSSAEISTSYTETKIETEVTPRPKNIDVHLDPVILSSFLLTTPLAAGSFSTHISTSTETDTGFKKLLTTIHVTLFSYVEKFF